MAKKKEELTNENYFDLEMGKKYCSVSQLKSFIGSAGQRPCEERAIAEMNGEYIRPVSDSLLLGSLVDCLLTEPKKYESFIESHPEMFSSKGPTKGELKAAYKIGLTMVDRCKRDSFFMKTLEGDKQTIMTGEIEKVPFKIKMDAYKEGKYITDLKTCRSITESFYNPISGMRESFIVFYDYILQGAIYQEIVYQNTGKKLPFFISAVSKENVPDIEVIQIDNQTLADRLDAVRDQIKNVGLLKAGKIEPCKCGECEYCREKKVLKKPINWVELAGEI